MAVDLYKTHKLGVNLVVDITPQTDTLRPDNTADTGKLNATGVVWHNIANCNTATIRTTTESDQKQYYDPSTLTRVVEDDMIATQRIIEFSVVNYPMLFEACYQGVPEPFSAATLAKMAAGEEMPIFQNDSVSYPIAARIKKYDKHKNLLATQYVYAKLVCTGDIAYDGKTVEPTLTLETQPSIHNVSINTIALTGETPTPDPPEDPEGT